MKHSRKQIEQLVTRTGTAGLELLIVMSNKKLNKITNLQFKVEKMLILSKHNKHCLNQLRKFAVTIKTCSILQIESFQEKITLTLLSNGVNKNEVR